MKTEQSGFYTASGELRGSYVYMLLCQKHPHIFIKVGVSDNPPRRLKELMTGCAVKPGMLCTFKLPSRKLAQRAETELHRAFKGWHTHREWFCVDMSEKRAFNDTLRDALGKYRKHNPELRWDKFNVDLLMDTTNKADSRAARLYRSYGVDKRYAKQFCN